MSTILLSFDAKTFEKLENGQMKFEYRKHLPEGKTTVYFYVSNPVKAISGVAHFGEREELISWLDKYSDRPKEVQDRIKEYLEEDTYAVEIQQFQPTNRISLQKLREDIPGFIVPRMYYYIDNSDLLRYLEQQLVFEKPVIVHNFDVVPDDTICN